MRFLRALLGHVLPGPHNSYRPYVLRRSSLMFLLGLVLVAEALLVGNLALRQTGLPFLGAVVASEVIDYTNVARAQVGGTTLHENALLTAAAHAKAADMADKGYFAHTGPDGKEPWQWLREIGYHYRAAGENLAVRFVDSHDVVDAWMGSPTHRANIVKPLYTEIGVGVAHGTYKGEPALFVVQYFGTPQGAVGGQGAAVATSDSYLNSFIRQVGAYAANPRAAATGAIAVVAFILVAAIAATVVRHIQVQPAHVLAPATAVAAIAIALLLVNSAALTPAPPGEAGIGAAVVVGSGAQVEQ